jgi:hypothetical protein
MKKAPPLPIKFASFGYGELREFASWVGAAQQGTLIGVTTLNVILVISISKRQFYKYRMEGRRKDEVLPLVNASVYGDYLFAFSQQQCHVCRYQNQRGEKKTLERLIQKVVTERRIARGEGVEREGKFYAFLLVENALVM